RGLLSSEHFTVDSTLIEAAAGLKSFRPKDAEKSGRASKSSKASRNAEVNFRGERRTNETHQSRTDPEARLFRKGNAQEAKLSYMGHLLTENRNGFAVQTLLTKPSGTAEREAALAMLRRMRSLRGATLGADKAFDVRAFVAE